MIEFKMSQSNDSKLALDNSIFAINDGEIFD